MFSRLLDWLEGLFGRRTYSWENEDGSVTISNYPKDSPIVLEAQELARQRLLEIQFKGSPQVLIEQLEHIRHKRNGNHCA